MTTDVKTCPECAEEVRAEASKCRFCGFRFDGNFEKPSPADKVASRKRGNGCGGIAVLGLILIVLVFFISKPGSRLASTPLGVDGQMQSIQDKVADDAVKQYNIASVGGKAIDRCVQAGLVAAAYLQAQNQQQYNSWKVIEASDCRTAGLRR